MRKLFVVLALVFAFAFGFGSVALDNAEAAGSGCFYTCDCAGRPLYCCPNQSGGVSCKASTVHQCTQVYNC